MLCLEARIATARREFLSHARRLVDASRIDRPPVDPALLANLCGIQRIVLLPGLPVSGQLVESSGELTIQLNAREPVERRNFTACHEIAHTFEVRSRLPKYRSSSGLSRCADDATEEALCDLAAAELLMPRRFFISAARDLSPSLTSVRILAQTFQASVRATLRRIGQLRVWPVVFIVWRFMPRPGSVSKLRVDWSVKPDGHRCFVPRFASASKTSDIYASFIWSRPMTEMEELNLGSLRGRFLVESDRFGEYVVSVVHDPRFDERAPNAR